MWLVLVVETMEEGIHRKKIARSHWLELPRRWEHAVEQWVSFTSGRLLHRHDGHLGGLEDTECHCAAALLTSVSASSISLMLCFGTGYKPSLSTIMQLSIPRTDSQRAHRQRHVPEGPVRWWSINFLVMNLGEDHITFNEDSSSERNSLKSMPRSLHSNHTKVVLYSPTNTPSQQIVCSTHCGSPWRLDSIQVPFHEPINYAQVQNLRKCKYSCLRLWFSTTERMSSGILWHISLSNHPPASCECGHKYVLPKGSILWDASHPKVPGDRAACDFWIRKRQSAVQKKLGENCDPRQTSTYYLLWVLGVCLQLHTVYFAETASSYH